MPTFSKVTPSPQTDMMAVQECFPRMRRLGETGFHGNGILI